MRPRIQTREGRSGRRLPRFVIVAVLLTAALLWPADVAGSSTFWWRTYSAGECAGGNSADSSYHTFYYNSGLSSVMRSATDYARAYAIDPMDLNTAMVALAVDTDVVVYDQDYDRRCLLAWHPTPMGVTGLAECRTLTPNPAGACEKAEVRYDESYTSIATTTERRWIACHELGHTLGLTHNESYPDTSCMAAENNGRTTYSWHERVDHIDPSY